MAKTKKKKTDKYEEKRKITGKFEEVIGVSVDIPSTDKKAKEQQEDVPGTDHDSLKKQDKPLK